MIQPEQGQAKLPFMPGQTPISDAARHEADARRHVDALKGLYVHAIIFALVMAGLLAINLLASKDWWVQWPLLAWGVGLAGHAVGVLSPVKLFGREWEERKIREYLARHPSGPRQG